MHHSFNSQPGFSLSRMFRFRAIGQFLAAFCLLLSSSAWAAVNTTDIAGNNLTGVPYDLGQTYIYAPPLIASVSPTSGAQGATVASLAIVGSNTNFVQGTSVLTFSGTGITVNSLTVTDGTHATANITISGGAATTARDVTVTTSAEVAVLTGGFTVFTPPSFVVTNNSDSGPGSLRSAITSANATTGSIITFDPTFFTSLKTITLASALPQITASMTITGPGTALCSVNGNALNRAFDIASGKTVMISGLTITNCFGQGGGAIVNSGSLTVTGCAISGSISGVTGGGILNQSTGTLILVGTTLSGNSAQNRSGGGLYNSGGTATATNCTFANNTAVDFGAGAFNVTGTMTLTNCTFSGNSAGQSTAIYNAGTLIVNNTLMYGNTTSSSSPDLTNSGGTASGDYNLSSDGSAPGTHSVTNTNALLGPLGYYPASASVQTFPLLPGSPAINAGTAAGTPTADQRGVARVGATDIGAFEAQAFTLALSSGNNQSTAVGTAFTNPLVVNVTGTSGDPVNGGGVTFTAPGSGASLNPATGTATVTSGSASLAATANTTAGGPYTVTATAAGASPTINFSLTNIVPRPTVTSLATTSGLPAGGTSVVITGTNFTGATAVKFGANAAGFTVNSATSITATSPAGSAGTVDVTVTTAGGTSATSAADQFTYASLPTVTSISPTSGSTAGGTVVVITGTNLTGATGVTIGGTAATLGANTGTTLSVTTGARAAGTGLSVLVTTPAGTNTANTLYTYAVPADIGTTFTGGNLTLDGSNSSGPTHLTFSVDGSGYLVIHDSAIPPRSLGSGPGIIPVDSSTIKILLSSITSLNITGTPFADTFNLDFTNDLPANISVNGGLPTLSPGDEMIIANTPLGEDGVYGPTGAGMGTISLTGGSGTNTISFTGLEPVDMSGAALHNFTINIDPTNVLTTNITTTVASADAGVNTLISFDNGLESVKLGTVTGTLTVNGSDNTTGGANDHTKGNDYLILNSLGTAMVADFVVDGKGGDADVIDINNTSFTVAGVGNNLSLKADFIGIGRLDAAPGSDQPGVINCSGNITLEANGDSGVVMPLWNVTGPPAVTGVWSAQPSYLLSGSSIPANVYRGTIQLRGDILKTAGSDATLTLKATGTVAIPSGATGTNLTGRVISSNNKLNVVVQTDTDSLNGGSVLLMHHATITTNGGDLTMGGGANPLTSPAVGTTDITTTAGGIVLQSSNISSGGGNISLRGQGANRASGHGVAINVFNGSVDNVLDSGTGNLTINGTTGTGSTNTMVGVLMNANTGNSVHVKTTTGSININGTSQSTGTSLTSGFQMQTNADIKASSTGNITITGSTAAAYAAAVADINITVTSPSTVAITSAGGNVSFIGDTMNLAGGTGTKTYSTSGSGLFTVKQRTNGKNIDLGATDTASLLGLSTAELGLITASTLQIGDANSGTINISAALNPTTFTTLALANNTTFGAFPAGFTSTISSATNFTNMTVTGTVSINNAATLSFASGGGFVPSAGQNFKILDNDGSDAISGNFSALAEGATLPNFLTSGINEGVTYLGGTGNDLIIGVAPTVTPSTTVVMLNATTLLITGSGFSTTPANNTVVLNDGTVGHVTSATPTQLTVTLDTPPASTGSLTAVVTTNGLSSGSAVQVATVTAYALATSALLEGPAAGTDSVVLTVTPETSTWTATANAAWLHTSASGTGSANVVFTFDANAGATRSGTLTIAGQTLTVTQAGSTYVAANPVTALVSTGLSAPNGVAVDGSGNVYIADGGNNAIKMWTAATNAVTTLVSSGLDTPSGVAVDGSGNVYIADSGNSAIKMWTAATNTVSTLVSSGLTYPSGVAVDVIGNVYFSDYGSGDIKKWTAATNTVSTLVSTGLNQPFGLAVDASGNVYIADTGNDAVKKWTAATNTVSTLVSTGLHHPRSVPVDGSGNVYIADGTNSMIKKWTAATNTVSTLISTGLNAPEGLAVDGSGNVYLSDNVLNVVKELPRAFVDPTAFNETFAAGADALPVVLPATENLLAPFAPTSDSGWLTLGSISGGVVNFNFTANTGAARTAHISLLGQSIAVNQAAVPAPTVTSLSPTSGSTAGGTVVTITGTHFTAATAVSFGGTAAASYSVTNDTTISATTPAGTPGTASVLVTNGGGTNAANSLYTYVAPPTVTLVTTNLAINAGTVTITGTGFSTTPANNTVTFNHGATGTVSSATTTSLTVTLNTSPTSVGSLTAVVTNTSTGLSSGSAVQVATVIPVITPSSANLAANASGISISGLGFDSNKLNDGVTFSGAGTGAGIVSAASTTGLGVSLPSSLIAGVLNASMTSNGVSSGTAVQVATITPVVTSSTASLAANATTVTINGAGFDPTAAHNSVTFNDGALGTVTSATNTSLTVTLGTTPTSAGPLTAIVTTNSVSSGSAVQVATVIPVVTSSTASIQTTASTVTIHGFGFDASNANNSVTLNLGATVSSITSTPTQIVVTFGTKPTVGNLTAVVTSNGQSSGSAVQVATVVNIGITPNTLPNWTVNMSGYSQTLTGTGGTSPYTFSVTAGALPTGLTLGTSTGLVSGTPTTAGTFNFTVTTTDNASASGSQSYSIVINSAVSVSPSTLPNWTVNNSGYSQTVTSSGGTGAKTLSITSGAIPTGMTFTAGTGALSGTPTTAGTFNFTVTATDTVGATGAQAYTVVVNGAVSVSPSTLPNWTVNKPGYTQTVTSSGGTGTKTLSITFGAVPTGMTFTAGTGALSGTPTAAGTFNFTVTATDTVGATGSQAYTVVINSAVSVSPSTLANWTVNTSGYSQTVTSSGGTGATTFSVTSGSLPTGLSLGTSTGVISGTPTTAGTFNFVVTATDTVNATGTQFYTLVINGAVAVTPASLPNWTVNTTGYTQTVTSSGGTGAKTLSITSGAIPTGMTFTAGTGALSGTPTTAGTFNFTVTATDTAGATGARAYSVVINPAISYGALSVTTWTVNQSGYSGTVAVSGGTGAYSGLNVTGLPTGLSAAIVGNTITISGTPTSAASTANNVSITLSDSVGATSNQTFTLTVNTLTITSSTASLAQNATQLIINGTGFSTTLLNNSVTLSSGSATVTAATATQLTCSLVGPLTLGTLNATATVVGNGSTSATQVATVVAAPTVTLATTSNAITATTVTIAGTGFDSSSPGNNTVTLNDGATGTVTSATATSLTVTFGTKPTAVGSLTAVVTSFGGTSGTAKQIATVAPVITSSSSNLSVDANTLLINGVGFDTTAANNTVSFSNGATGTVTSATGTQLTVTFGTHATSLGSMTASVTTDTVSSGSAVQVATVIAGAATHFTVTAPGTATAGVAINTTVTALDQFGNTAISYTGTVHFTTTDVNGSALVPVNYSFLAGDNGAHTFTGGVKLVTAGTQKVTATDTVTGSITGTSSNIVVSPAAATHFSVTAPGTATAGVAISSTVTALDAFGNTATGYTGTVHFTTSDSGASVAVPANYAFVSGDSGVHTFTGSVTLVTAGTQTVTATDTVTGTINGTTANIVVGSAAASQLIVTAPGTATAGVAINTTVTAKDAFGNTATGYLGTVHFTKTDSGSGSAVPVNYNFAAGDNGVHTFTGGVILVSAGSRTVTATDTVTGSITGTSGTISVSAAAATHLIVSAPGTATAGTAVSVSVTAQDAFGNTATAYAGTVHFTSTDASSVLPANSTLTAGAGNFNVTFKTAATQTVTATDTVTGSITGTTGNIAVSAAAASHLAVSAASTATAGVAINSSVTALDPYGNTALSYTGTVHFTASDAGGSVVLPVNYTFLPGDNGVHVFSGALTFVTAGTQTLTATDTISGSITGTSTGTTVSAAAATHLAVTAPGTATAGVAVTATVTALDQYGNTATSYLGTVNFTKTDAGSSAAVPANYNFVAGDNGAHTFTGGVTLVTAGSQTVTATDTVTGTITGTSGNIAVNPAATSHFVLTGPSLAGPGTPVTITVTAEDAFNNITPAYTGTVAFTLTDSGSGAAVPSNYTFLAGDAGVHTFTNGVTFATPGQQTLTATDTVSSSVKGSAIFNVGTLDPTPTQLVPTNPVTGLPLPPGSLYPVISQSGTIEVRVSIKNTTAFPINGFRLSVDYSAYLPFHSLVLYNRTSPSNYSEPAHIDYIDYPYPVAVGDTVSLKLQFYTTTRTLPNPFSPTLTVTKLATSAVSNTDGTGVQPRIRMLPTNNILLEWDSTAGQWYRIKYSSDLVNWFDCPVPVQGVANRTQWVDDGPPFTNAPPSSVGARYYKLNTISAPTGP